MLKGVWGQVCNKSKQHFYEVDYKHYRGPRPYYDPVCGTRVCSIWPVNKIAERCKTCQKIIDKESSK